MANILSSVTVIEMGTYITGPAAAMQLADLGANVIKVERPGMGDPFRAFKGELYSPHFQTYNRNKRSIALDTTKPEDLEVMHGLIRDADVFIQNFRPGVAEKLGVGEDDLRAIRPDLIYCAISGFGRTGPGAERPTFDTVAQAASGFLRLVTPPENPRVIGPAIADAITGQYAATGIMAALLERAKSGKGHRLDISMLEAMCHFNLDSFTHYYSEGEIMGPLSRPSVSQSYTFRCKDDKWIAFHLSSPEKFWTGLLTATGQEALASDPRFAKRPDRIANQDELIAIFTPVFASADRDIWCERLLANEVPHSPAYDSNEALEDAQAQHLGIKVSAEHPQMGTFTTVRPPYTFDGETDRTVVPPPVLDEHGDDIRRRVKSAT
ncbi:MAG TPA: carnitine dehydratase [Rhodospirillaceae bacterium]|mgnify:CR=1 FL=1|nr:carnitine dehydratase [Alphaproteobacteria bacterium]MAS47791.1 carnitine dehydratase [Alphaproteobacteria bacterium]MAX96953.1 carnitine dehydratase [Alphaproteobacteria bacterium]OUT40216.1 MAG: carnitine dehydratase [Micavibrio sp. TMED2]HCI46682.1 carnitine dehydratase [Rhodospirillaceae bacterium]|tara:strand:- start:2261 stop:3400 length:1140 start_codon:yes stop_codon:yes gene_type:complete